jgi:cytochrome c553
MKKSTMIGVGAALALLVGQACAGGDAAAGKSKSESCGGCHGEDGNANAPIFPKLAGQHASYLVKQLNEFKTQKRMEPTMNAMAESLSETDIADIGAYYAKQRFRPEAAEPSALGEKIFRAGIAAKAVPACTACHGPDGGGNPNSGYPALRGQFTAYTSKSLHDYKSGERNNDANGIMRAIAARMSDEEIAAVSDYALGLK